MRIRALDITNVPPVKRFQVGSLSDVVVLAGPNGVGKTRLVEAILQAFQAGSPHPAVRMQIEATDPDERTLWDKSILDTRVPDDVAKLSRTLQKNRARSNLVSNVIQFESDRTIQQIQPYGFSWDATDPWEESIGWNYTFSRLRDRFQDTLHSIYRKIRSRREAIATRAEEHLKQGHLTMDLDGFPDPIEPFKAAFRLLLAPKELVEPDPKNQQLYYTYDGQSFPVTSLSSGEREVVNIVFDFLLRNPAHSVVFFDEPELHLHPELSYKLFQTLRTIGTSNQFIFCTHSADIITSSLDHTVIFLAPPTAAADNQAIAVREDDDTHQALRLLGHSIGIIALGKKLVLIEGEHASLDKQVYGTILRNRFPDLVLVPSGGKASILSFSTHISRVLERTIWGIEFFLLCDRDAVPLGRPVAEIEAPSKGRLKILPRYHLENYLLEEAVLARVFAPMEIEGSWLRSADQIRTRLKDLARGMISYTTALIVAAEYREKAGNIDLVPDGCHEKSEAELAALILTRASTERGRIGTALDPGALEVSVKETFAKVRESIDDGDTWKETIPGRPLINKFAALAKIEPGRLKLLYLQEASRSRPSPFEEVIRIFEQFNALPASR